MWVSHSSYFNLICECWRPLADWKPFFSVFRVPPRASGIDLNQQVSASQDKFAEMSTKLRTERCRISREKQRSSLEESATFSEAGYKSRVQQPLVEARDLDDKPCMALSDLEPPFETNVDDRYWDEVGLCCYSSLSIELSAAGSLHGG